MARGGALASDTFAQEAAQGVIKAGGSALQAALTGYFTATGIDSGVLFAPMTILVGGVGAGVFAYDGRCRQPGRDAKRPRGFLPEDEIPLAATVAAPASIGAAATAVAFHPGTTLLSCVRPGVQAAKAEGAKGRAELLEFAASLGATALHAPAVKKAFKVQFGTLEEGAITPTDLASPEGLNTRAKQDGNAWVPEWNQQSVDSELDFGSGHGIVAADGRGLLVAITYRQMLTAAVLEPFETRVPCLASPVRRGVTRAHPGAAIATPQDLRIEKGESGKLGGVSVVPYKGASPLRLLRAPETREIIFPTSL